MKKMLTLTFMFLFTVALAYSPKAGDQIQTDPGCIVMPEVVEACYQSGGRFDYTLCSCVGGGGQSLR